MWYASFRRARSCPCAARLPARDRRDRICGCPADRGVQQVVAATARSHAAGGQRDDQWHGTPRLDAARRRRRRVGRGAIRHLRRRHAIGACRRIVRGDGAAADGFACSARLPTLTAGAHTLELASFITDGSVLESARSAALRVTVVAQVESAVKTGAEPLGSKSSDITIRPVTLADGTRLVVELVAGGLNQPGGSRVRAGRPPASSRSATAPFAASATAGSRSRPQSRTDGRPASGSSRSRSIRISRARDSCSRLLPAAARSR